jgi:hypothetical protein
MESVRRILVLDQTSLHSLDGVDDSGRWSVDSVCSPPVLTVPTREDSSELSPLRNSSVERSAARAPASKFLVSLALTAEPHIPVLKDKLQSIAASVPASTPCPKHRVRSEFGGRRKRFSVFGFKDQDKGLRFRNKFSHVGLPSSDKGAQLSPPDWLCRLSR